MLLSGKQGLIFLAKQELNFHRTLLRRWFPVPSTKTQPQQYRSWDQVNPTNLVGWEDYIDRLCRKLAVGSFDAADHVFCFVSQENIEILP